MIILTQSTDFISLQGKHMYSMCWYVATRDKGMIIFNLTLIAMVVSIKNIRQRKPKGNSRMYNVNIGYTRHRTKTNKTTTTTTTKNSTQKTKNMSNTDPTKTRGQPRCSRSVNSFCFLKDRTDFILCGAQVKYTTRPMDCTLYVDIFIALEGNTQHKTAFVKNVRQRPLSRKNVVPNLILSCKKSHSI